MQSESPAFIWDAQEASKRIVSVTQGHDVDEYLDNWVLQAAVECQLEILGEALKKLRVADPVTLERIPNAHAIIATRNILVHAYARVDQEKVWDILTSDLPVLVSILEGPLAEAGRD
ncbi:MAG: DUF86 domain-containing protein [Microbacteriaceae bacterium]|nr:MAG: DUF86 domain-containing protein [Microbacteriaceae bacterium]